MSARSRDRDALNDHRTRTVQNAPVDISIREAISSVTPRYQVLAVTKGDSRSYLLVCGLRDQKAAELTDQSSIVTL